MLAFDRALLDRDRVALDKATSARTFDADGRMHVANCRISKANVCGYYGREIPNAKGLGLDPTKLYMLYRDPVELEKAAPTFANLQLLMRHVPVNANDAKPMVTVGTVGSTISFDGTYLCTDRLTVWTKEGIKAIETEEQAELSPSYRYAVDMTPGSSPEGVMYDGRMYDMKGNHVALVKTGRQGPDVYVNDEQPEPPTMKRPRLLAALIATGIVTKPADEAATLALDEALAALTAKDAAVAKDVMPDDEEDDPENPGQRRKKINPGKGEPTKVGGALASDEAIETAIKAKGYVTAADAQTMANDAAAKAETGAVARVNALHAAREAVKPLVGIVAMDSAEAVYKFALTAEKVALDGVPAAAYPALVAQRVALKSAGAGVAKSGAPVFAADAASAASAALPGLSRITVAG